MNKTIKFYAIYKNKRYSFDFGSEAFVFQLGVYNAMDEKYGIKGLLEFVGLVHDCYLSDGNSTAIGSLSDFIAANWLKLKCLGKSRILDLFYEKENGDLL